MVKEENQLLRVPGPFTRPFTCAPHPQTDVKRKEKEKYPALPSMGETQPSVSSTAKEKERKKNLRGFFKELVGCQLRVSSGLMVIFCRRSGAE